jgi:hypothetical protein
MIISAYTVTSETRGFARCSWPANSLADAERLAQELSQRLADDPRYPNAFWVIGQKDKPQSKWWRGQRYATSESI